MPDTVRPTRQPLDRQRVLRTAVDLADRDGLDALSMRALATELGVVPMALYKHVTDKSDLLSGMLDLIVGGYAAPAPGTAWRDAVRARVLSARQALLAHPWLRQAIEAATRRTPIIMGHMDAVAGEFIDGGLSVDLTHHAMHALGHRIWGFNPEAFSAIEASAPALSPDEQEATMRMMSERFPHVTAIAIDSATRNPSGACDEQFEFEFTLDLLLDAFGRLHETDWSSQPRRDRASSNG